MTRVDLRPPLQPNGDSPRAVYLREISGYDELSDISATDLIDRLLIDRPGTIARSGEALELTLSDADRVFAAIYQKLFGELVECQVRCGSCPSRYTMSFTLSEMWAAACESTPEEHELDGPDNGGMYRSGNLVFRLPRLADAADVAGLDQEDSERELRARCVVQEDPNRNDDVLDRLMSMVGPTLDSDLDSTCPECGTDQVIPFRIDEFLMAAMKRERSMLTREVHELALAYRWSRREILEMTRDERRQHTRLLLAEGARV